MNGFRERTGCFDLAAAASRRNICCVLSANFHTLARERDAGRSSDDFHTKQLLSTSQAKPSFSCRVVGLLCLALLLPRRPIPDLETPGNLIYNLIPFPSRVRSCTGSWDAPPLSRDPLSFRFAREKPGSRENWDLGGRGRSVVDIMKGSNVLKSIARPTCLDCTSQQN